MPDKLEKPTRKLSPKPLTTLAKKFFTWFENPLAAGLLTFFVFTLIAINFKTWGTTTPVNYYSYLADAFIHGQLNLRLEPTVIHDLSIFQGKLYLYWPPFPALLSIPLVLLFGINFSDVILTTVVASLGVAIVAQLLRKCNARKLLDLSVVQRGLLVFTLACGSALTPLITHGTVWALGLIIGLMFIEITYLVVVSTDGWKAFLFAGLSISAAVATRNTLILAGIWPAYYLLQQHWHLPWKKLSGYILLGAIPILLTLLFLGLYNYARFGSFTEFGISYHNMGEIFRQDFEKFGAFNLHYIPRNLYYQWIAYPPFAKTPDEFAMGGSLLLLSPVFFGAFWGFKDRSLRPHVLILALTIIIVYIPIVLLMGTGYSQIGPRYLLDFMVPILILTGIGIKYWPTRITGMLVAISFIHYMSMTLLVRQ